MQKVIKSISVCMIVKNEAETLARILSDARCFADEIIVVDTGSTDSTKEIAKAFTDKVYDFAWQNDFSAARNAAFSYASHDYMMWLDADDRVPPQSILLLNALKEELTDEDVIMLPYETAFEENVCVFRYFRERILKRGAGFLFTDPVHEVVVPHGKIAFREIPIQHRKEKPPVAGRNLEIYRALLQRGEPLNTRQKYYFANELWANGLLSEATAQYYAFLASSGGMAENRDAARRNLARLEKNNYKKAFQLLTDGFYEGEPSAETLVELGHILVREERFSDAIPWYKRALSAPPPSDFAFRNKDMEAYIPALQLALCYHKLGDKKNAIFYNAIALEAKGSTGLAMQNQTFYDAMLD